MCAGRRQPEILLALATRVHIRVSEVSERGAVMTEYGMLLFLVAVAAFGVLGLFGGEVLELFTETESEFDSSRQIPPDPD